MVFIGVGGNCTTISLAFLPPPSPQVAIPLDLGVGRVGGCICVNASLSHSTWVFKPLATISSWLFRTKISLVHRMLRLS